MVDRTYWRERIEAAWRVRSVVWLSGVRRSGKTTLCRGLSDIEYLDCESPRTRSRLAEPEVFLESMRGRRVAIDEIHLLDRPTEVLKIAADYYPGVSIIATGSSTLGASAKFADTLTGRKTDVRLTPMIEADRADFGGTLTDRLWRGGLPPFYLGESTDVAYAEWIDSYWARDVQELFRLQRRSAFVKFVQLLLVNSGGTFEATSYAAPAGVSRTTIAEYLRVLEETNVAVVVRPFTTRMAAEIVKAPRVYAFDTGFVRYAQGWVEPRSDDLGRLWEHYVLNEMCARLADARIAYWRTKQHDEVDFIIVRRGKPPVAVECKWSSANIGDLKALTRFRTDYPDGEDYVVCPDAVSGYARRVGSRTLRVVGLAELLEALTL